MGDGDDDQQIEHHSEKSEAAQQCSDEYDLGSNRHWPAGGVEGRDTEVSCFQCLHHHQRKRLWSWTQSCWGQEAPRSPFLEMRYLSLNLFISIIYLGALPLSPPLVSLYALPTLSLFFPFNSWSSSPPLHHSLPHPILFLLRLPPSFKPSISTVH